MTSVSTELLFVLISLFFVSPLAEAIRVGDAIIALLLGVVSSIAGICVCLGASAQKRNERCDQMRLSRVS
ncbi:putative transmembrane protein [Sciurus carolinensis]|uniref:Transmembrane protein n=1 Tax=Sciurus carolinensis TaxID=30640 RepID=A0AA41NCQ5_SCICA|nr:small integral membrane protein 30-like [Sciurus carolinensis]MBZ3887960.1 putative transmembrane protein [Sciurus carolinensis]